jgi:hypothetical protein
MTKEIENFKPFQNDSQQTRFGSDEIGELTFSNDLDEIEISGSITIKKNSEGVKQVGYLIEMLQKIQTQIEPSQKRKVVAK